MDAVSNVHQTMVEVPVDIAREFGYPEEKASALKASHRRILDRVYGSVCSSFDEFSDLAVKQAGELRDLIEDQSSPPPTNSGAGPKKSAEGKKSKRKKKGKH